MELRRVRCKRCKNLYEYETGLPPEFCPDCTAEKNIQAFELREIVRQNRGITSTELHQRTGVSIEKINKYIEDGLFEIIP